MAAANTIAVVIDTSGLNGVVSALKQRSITRKAVGAMARVVRPAVKAEAPVRKGGGGGTLKSSIGIKTAVGKRGKSASYAVVGARTKVQRTVTVKTPRGTRTITAIPSKYQHLVALGTRPHSLAKSAKLLRRGKKGFDVGQDSGNRHPGAAANNFLVRGFNAKRTEAMAAGQKKLGEEVQKAIAQEASKLLGRIL